MTKIIEFIKKYRLPLLSGLFVGTSYIPLLPWAIFFCYLPLWYWLLFKANSPKEGFVGAWITQFFLTLIGFHWIAYTAKEFGQFPWPLAILTLIAFSALAHLYIPLNVYICMRLKKLFFLSDIKTLILLATGHSLAEIFWPSIFPWNLGYTLLWAKLPIYQYADIVGFLGLSFLLLMGQCVLAKIWFSKNTNFRVRSIQTSIFLLIFLGLNILGSQHGLSWKENLKDFRVLNVQANIGNLEKIYAEKGQNFREEIIRKFIKLSEEGLDKFPQTQIVMWPESSVPEYLNPYYMKYKNQTLIKEFLKSRGTNIFTGALSKDRMIDDPDRSVFNGTFLLNENGDSIAPPYHKTYLLAFGEFLPFSETFPVLLKWLPFISNFGRGQGPHVMLYPKDLSKNEFIALGPQICYEGLYPEFSIGLAKKGAEVIFNVTNDSWFGIPFEPYQHLYMTLARAIEVRRPLIRSTNTGISASITAYGELGVFSPWNKEWFDLYTIKYQENPPLSFFTSYGHYFWIFILIIFLATAFIGFIESGLSKDRLITKTPLPKTV